MKVLTALTARSSNVRGELNQGLSVTIPDQAVSPAELLRRFATGQPLGFKDVTPVYDDDYGEVPELYKMNKMDRLHAMQESHHNLIEKRNIHDDYVKEQQAKKAAKNAAETEKIKAPEATQTEAPAQRSEASGEVK